MSQAGAFGIRSIRGLHFDVQNLLASLESADEIRKVGASNSRKLPIQDYFSKKKLFFKENHDVFRFFFRFS